MTWIIGIVAVIAALAAIGIYSGKKARKEAPQKLQEAKAAFSQGELNQTLSLLEGAFYEPLDERYDAADAAVAYEAIELLEQTLAQMGTDPERLLGALKARLGEVRAAGGEVSQELTEPVRKFLEQAQDDPSLADQLMREVLDGNLKVVEERDGPEMSDDQAAQINEIGRLLLKGKPQDAVAVATRHLESAEGDFRVDLLGQRGGANFMAKQYAEAVEDYLACTQLQPDRSEHFANLAEAQEKLGQREAAAQTARHILAQGGDRDSKRTAEEVLKRVG